MKEQDAAHSFEKEKIESLELENERLKQAYKYIHASRDSVDEELNQANKELTRLRSELQQKDDKARNQAIDLFREVLSTLQSKEAEYKECSVESNPNWEYFKGKADAYEFAVKQLRRVFEWKGATTDCLQLFPM